MNIATSLTSSIPAIKTGAIAVIRTDTLYGLVARADNQSAVREIFRIKHRNIRKTCIVLVGSEEDIFDDASRQAFRHAQLQAKDEPTSIIVTAGTTTPAWLIAEDGTIAYRLPKDETLRDFLRQTGPLVAPSANPEGEEPATSIDEAIAYFDDAVSMYVDGGVNQHTRPSRIIRVDGMNITYLR